MQVADFPSDLSLTLKYFMLSAATFIGTKVQDDSERCDCAVSGCEVVRGRKPKGDILNR